MEVLYFASVYKKAAFAPEAHANLHRWAANIVNQAFQQVMGREPTSAERQIVMAVSDLESNYGKGWKNEGAQSHNWGAVQTANKSTPQFSYEDSSAQGKYTTGFKAYDSDISGAADVVRLLFKAPNKQKMPDPNNAFRTMGSVINGPTRGELISEAAQQGDTDAFSRAMWYTTYFEGTSPNFTDRIKTHANRIQSIVNSIASALGEPVAWSQKTSDYFLPVTSDTSVINQISNMTQKGSVNTPPTQKPQQSIESILPQKQQENSGLESLLWF